MLRTAALLLAVLLVVQARDHHRSRRSVTTVFSLNERLAALSDFSDISSVHVENQASSIKASIQTTANAVTSAGDAVTTASAAQLDARANALNGLLAAVQAGVNTIVPNLNSVVSTLSTQVFQESVARQTAASQLASLTAAIDTAVSASIVAGVLDRSTMRANAGGANTIYPAASAQVAASVSSEVSRAAVEAAAQSAAMSAVRVTASTTIQGGVSAEATRADSACSTMATSVAVNIAVLTGTTDHTACTTAGTVYYSSASKNLFLCTDGFFTPISYVGPFFGTKVLSTAQASSLSRVLGPYKSWTRCFVMSVDGSSCSTWRSKCNGKGPTVILAKTTNGYMFGGYNNQGWTSKGGYYVTSIRGMLFRFTGTSTVETATCSNYPQYAYYDENSYGPTFGNGHDLYFPTTMTSTSTSANAYMNNINYSSSWLGQVTGSPSISELEAWVLAQ